MLAACAAATLAAQEPGRTQSDPQGRPQAGRVVFEAVDDRYLPLPPFDRYGRRRPWNPFLFSDGTGEYPILCGGGLLDVYNVNWLKGDEPILGENTFLLAQLVSANTYEVREKTGLNPPRDVEKDFKSTEFLTVELFYGDTVFRPPSWRVRATVAADFRHADIVTADELDTDDAVQELFVEALLWETDPWFDFAALRVGRQAFASDFRAFVFADNNDGALLFGTARESRIDYELGVFDLVAKDPISLLNRGSESRDQVFAVASVFLEDFVADGYELQGTLQWAHDTLNQDVDAYYVGLNGDGRIGGLEVAHAAYLMFGEDEANPIAGRAVDTFGQLLALEVAVPDDWCRWVFSGLYASGDRDPADGRGGGFDSVFDNPAFAGGAFNFFHHQAVVVQNGAANVLISNTNSFYPNLRGKAVAAPNSVNPGLFLLHAGFEADLSNHWSVAANALYLRFADTAVLESIFGQSLDPGIGFDVGVTATWRPFGVDNLIVTPGVQALFPTGGFADINGDDPLFAAFVNMVLVL